MPDTPDRVAPLTLLAFDFGLRRIGVAVGQSVTGTATPLATLDADAGAPDWPVLDRLIGEWRPGLLVVGMPLGPAGETQGELAKPVTDFAAALGRYGLPVELADERLSSAEAAARLREARSSGARRRRVDRKDVDALAACVIAEQWLNARAGG